MFKNELKIKCKTYKETSINTNPQFENAISKPAAKPGGANCVILSFRLITTCRLFRIHDQIQRAIAEKINFSNIWLDTNVSGQSSC